MKLTKEILKKATDLIGDGYKCPFAELMKQNGFDPDNGDLMILPKKHQKKISEAFSFNPFPDYVRFSEYIDKGYFTKNCFSIEQISRKTIKTITLL